MANLRVIAGEAKGIRLKNVSSNQVRPTTDRVKESLFNIIGPFFDGGNSLDLFAGSGALSLEALSRGIDSAYLVDKSRQSIETIHHNVSVTKYEKKVKIINSDAWLVVKNLKKNNTEFSLIFLDPPYKQEKLLEKILSNISDLLTKDGLLVIEHPSENKFEDNKPNLRHVREMVYGSTTISLYQRADSE